MPPVQITPHKQDHFSPNTASYDRQPVSDWRFFLLFFFWGGEQSTPWNWQNIIIDGPVDIEFQAYGNPYRLPSLQKYGILSWLPDGWRGLEKLSTMAAISWIVVASDGGYAYILMRHLEGYSALMAPAHGIPKCFWTTCKSMAACMATSERCSSAGEKPYRPLIDAYMRQNSTIKAFNASPSSWDRTKGKGRMTY